MITTKSLKSYFKTLLFQDTLTSLRHKRVWDVSGVKYYMQGLLASEAIAFGIGYHWYPGLIVFFTLALSGMWKLWGSTKPPYSLDM
jgi:hypothetical protein